MKKLLIASAVALSLSSLGAHAAVISAGGIQWDDDLVGAGGFAGQVNFQQWFTNTATTTDDNGTAGDLTDDYQRITSDVAVAGAVGTELVGIGEFYSLNDGRAPNSLFNPAFCVTQDCELTLAFGGLIVAGIGGTGPIFDTSNAWFNVYVQQGPDFDSLDPNDTIVNSNAHTKLTEAQNGDLWAAFNFDSFILDGTLIGGESEASLSIRTNSGLGLADVQTALNYNDPALAGSDIGFTAGATFVDNNAYTLDGNGQVIGVSVPEPSTIALFGLSLLGLAGAARRKRG
ncbi:MAG: hypothetical protein ACJA13_003005 [Paraglaciecola sp.]|jgi:hypothetical protein